MADVANEILALKSHAPDNRPPLELGACIGYCEAMVKARRHNFPVASIFVPSALRPHIWSVYAFARIADDIVDGDGPKATREAALDVWEDHLTSAYFGNEMSHPVMVALMDTVKRFDLPITEFRSIISGMRSELERTSYSTYQALREHSALVSGSLVRLLLYLGGHKDETLHRHARDLGEAVAHTRWWQDLSRGAIAQRYLPEEDKHHFDFQLGGGPKNDRFVEYLAARTRAALVRAQPVVDLVGPNLSIEMALFWWGTEIMLRKIERAGSRVFVQRPTLTSRDKANVVLRALAWRGGEGVPWRLSRHLPSW